MNFALKVHLVELAWSRLFMVPQWNLFTKPFFASTGRLFTASALLFCFLEMSVAPAHALVKMETKTINAALVYGMQSQKSGLSALLGPNWIEGENGALLNVYSPFMMLAAKASKSGLSARPAKSDLEKARNRFGRDVAFYADPKNRLQVKFAVSLYGDTPDFAKGYSAHIVGIGRGKEFDLKPIRQMLDQIADPLSGGQSGSAYEAVNSYYFNFADLENLEEYRFVLESPRGQTLTFRINNEHLY
jgi:hypothetical protein